ncbi:MAG: ATP-binding protein [Oscillospiraceae bacterium]|nr:ATP-binding protein [Oscillospiraceae bacterium]
MERNDRLIKKKVYKYMLTGIMTTIALQLGNVVDAVIVGNLIGSIGNSAVSASIPYIYLLQAAAILLSSGGSVTAAILLGKRDCEKAGKVMGFCLAASLGFSLVMMAISPVSVPAFISLTKADGILRSMMSDLIFIYSFGMPVITVVLVMSYFMNIDSHPALAANMNITANAVNLILDFILVRYTPLGIKGAALSSVLGYLAAGMIFIPLYLKSHNRMLRPVLKGMSETKSLIYETMKNGLPNFSYLIITVISMAMINSGILSFLGGAYYSAYAVANNTQHIVQMFINGIASVIASIAGVLYGEKDYFGMRAVLKKVLRSALTAGAVLTAVFLAAPQLLAGMYGFRDETVLPELLTGLRLFSLSFGFFILNSIAQNYYRTIGQTFLSALSTALELLIVRIPLMMLGMHTYGFRGLFGAMIISELLSFVMINIIRIVMQMTGRTPQSGFMAIPEHKEGEICDIIVKGSDETAVNISESIIGYCLKENMSSSRAQTMGIAAEELISNISKYGYKSTDDKDIDICLSKTDDRFYLRIRDDGIPFDPLSYDPVPDDGYIGGLELLRKMAVKISYMRVISLNNTIIEIPCEERRSLRCTNM